MSKKGILMIAAFAMFFFLAVPKLSLAISLKELISRYSFDTATSKFNATSFADYMIDKDGNGINDTLILEISANSASGRFNFSAIVFDGEISASNSSSANLQSGQNKINFSFPAYYFSGSKFNYSVLAYYNSSLAYRKDKTETGYYSYYEAYPLISEIEHDFDESGIDITIRSNLAPNRTKSFAVIYFDSRPMILNMTDFIDGASTAKISRSLLEKYSPDSVRIASATIGGKRIILNKNLSYSKSILSNRILSFSDAGIDSDSDGFYESLSIWAALEANESRNYFVIFKLYSQFGEIISSSNKTFYLQQGKNNISLNASGSLMILKETNGPYNLGYFSVYGSEKIIEKNSAYETSYYDFDSFEDESLPDISVRIFSSDLHRIGIANATINVSVKNTGKSPAAGFFTRIFDNLSLDFENFSSVLLPTEEINYLFSYANASDFEFLAFADYYSGVYENEEGNNAKKITINLNKKPKISQIKNLTYNETDSVRILLNASDENFDSLNYSSNFSKITIINSTIFWKTETLDSGNYTINLSVSDGFLSDYSVFKIEISDMPLLDSDNDGINESEDRIKGDERNINSSINISVFISNKNNLSRVFNSTEKLEIKSGNSTLVEMNFDFSNKSLDLSRIRIEKHSYNQTPFVIINGLENVSKTVYLDAANISSGICIKEKSVESISEISSFCNFADERPVECDSTLQNEYSCALNSTLGSYKISGLMHSAVVLFDYQRPKNQESSSISGSASSSGSSGSCVSRWLCSEWSSCSFGYRKRECQDIHKCKIQTGIPKDSEKCGTHKNPVAKINFDFTRFDKTHQNAANESQLLDFAENPFSQITGNALAKREHQQMGILEFAAILAAVSMIIICGICFYQHNTENSD